MKKVILAAITLLSVASLSFGQTGAEDFNRSMLPIPDQPFKGKIGLRAGDSVKDFPKEVKAPEDAPTSFSYLRTTWASGRRAPSADRFRHRQWIG